MNRITWNNKTFWDMGVVVEKTPKISKAKKRITQYTVPGRNGVLT